MKRPLSYLPVTPSTSHFLTGPWKQLFSQTHKAYRCFAIRLTFYSVDKVLEACFRWSGSLLPVCKNTLGPPYTLSL